MPVIVEDSTSIWDTKMARASRRGTSVAFANARVRFVPTPPTMLVGKGSTDNEPDCYRVRAWVDVCTPALEPIREGVVEVALIPLNTT